jgi:hypothetical protein
MAAGGILVCSGISLLLPLGFMWLLICALQNSHRDAINLARHYRDKTGACQKYRKVHDDLSQCISPGRFQLTTSSRLPGIAQKPALDMLVSRGMCQPRASRKEKERNVASACSGWVLRHASTSWKSSSIRLMVTASNRSVL